MGNCTHRPNCLDESPNPKSFVRISDLLIYLKDVGDDEYYVLDNTEARLNTEDCTESLCSIKR